MPTPTSTRTIPSILQIHRSLCIRFKSDAEPQERGEAPVRSARKKWVLVLAALVLLGAASPALAARGGNANLPRCLQSMEGSTALVDYVTYLNAHSNVLSAFSPCRYPAEVLSSFVSKLERAEISGEAPSAALPAAYLTKKLNQNGLNITEAEGIEIVSAKLAHIFFLEVRGLVPWLLADYDDAALDSLFDVCRQLGCSFSRKNKTVGFHLQYLVDHSPLETWSLLSGTIDLDTLTDPTSGVEAIVTHAQQFRHGSRDLDPDLGIVTINEMATE